jgi:hypothetical protein
MVEHVSVTADRRTIVYSANTGSDRDDLDRRHVFRSTTDSRLRQILPNGNREGIALSHAIKSRIPNPESQRYSLRNATIGSIPIARLAGR